MCLNFIVRSISGALEMARPFATPFHKSRDSYVFQSKKLPSLLRKTNNDLKRLPEEGLEEKLRKQQLIKKPISIVLIIRITRITGELHKFVLSKVVRRVV